METILFISNLINFILVLVILHLLRQGRGEQRIVILTVPGGNGDNSGTPTNSPMMIHRVVSIGRSGEIQFFNGETLATSIQFPGADELARFRGAMADVYVVPRTTV